MDQFLADYYGTTKTAAAAPPEADAIEKRAEFELFLKIAADQGIDLNAMPDEDLARLYSTFTAKLAEDKEDGGAENDDRKPRPKPKADEERRGAPPDEKHAQAEREFEEKRAMARELAQSEFLGRNAAHAYVDELKKIAAAARAHDAMAEAAHGIKTASGDQTASAFDDMAIERALAKAAEVGWDPQDAAQRIDALYTLNLVGESAKVAHASNVEQALEIRALEFLEGAGYPVTWPV